MLFTSTLIILLTGLSVVVVSATNSDQIPLGENESHHGKKRYNVTLNVRWSSPPLSLLYDLVRPKIPGETNR